jgi:hypothetical protein
MLMVAAMIGPIVNAQSGDLSVTTTGTASSFAIVGNKAAASFYYDKNDAAVVGIAAQAFKKDVADITGKEMSVTSTAIKPSGDHSIVAGTIGHSSLIDDLIAHKEIDVSAVKGKWEAFIVAVINQPGNPARKSLVIAGSDRRGTAFGIFHLSRAIGVSPFVWWADAVPLKCKQLFVSGSYTSSVPSVKYRGIFINDEDWGLQPWAAKNMDKDIKDIGPKTYAKVFELMLRLKANYIWPAMHPCTKAFYYYKDNPKVADDYAIIVGGSHCEPMLRNNVFEWTENFEHEYGKKPGEWRYDVNKDEIYKYWDDRVKQATNYESVYTVGMRGIHDGSMPGPRDPNEKMKLLESVINDQRKILGLNFSKPASEVPQIFVPYKEVLSLYRRGLQLADDVTIIWPDDNHGYIRQLPNEQERKRSGGHGVYYHLSYWGSPQDYLWLSSISPSLIAYEMNKAYHYGADRLWVFNVGDIKPAELELQFAMDMAWDINNGTQVAAIDYTKKWAKEIFGDELADEIADIKNEYYLLAQSGKPEHMNSVELSFGEAKDRLERYTLLSKKTDNTGRKVPAALKDAYYELVLYPVYGATLMNHKILSAKLSFYHYPTDKLESANQVKETKESFKAIEAITSLYNESIVDGKWNGIMSWHPRDQAVFKMPATADAATALQRDSLAGRYFKQPEPKLVLQATGYMSKNETTEATIQSLKGLGVNGRGCTVVLKDNKTRNISPADNLWIEYRLPASLDAGEYEVVVKCLPVFDVNTSKYLRYDIAVNNEAAQTANVHAEADSREWKENVIRGYSAGKTKHTIAAAPGNKLRIYFKDVNLVINTIELYKQP